MKRTLLTIFGILTATLLVRATGADKLTVQIKNVKNTEGIISVSIFDSEGTWLRNGKTKEVTIADNTLVVVEFDDLPSGTYAVYATHDKNANGDLDSNFMGIPTEAYGFSNDARGMFGPATFEESKFQVIGNTTIQVTIK